jgi:colanic acid/amylovoran biosynthesis glycosyltransferase
MRRVLVFAERMLPSTQTFIPLQVNELQRYKATYVGLIPPQRNFPMDTEPIRLTKNRSWSSRVRRELYRWTGIAPFFHGKVARVMPQLVHAHFAEGTSAAVFLSKRLGVPLLLHLRGGAELLPDSELRHHLFHWPFLAYRRELWKRASLFICVSQYIRERALRAGFPEDKLLVHYTGMDCARFTPRAPISEVNSCRILYVGRLVPYKGCDYLLRAMQRVQQNVPDARLIIIGDGTFRQALETLNCELGVKAEFLGEQSQQTIRWWQERSRVFCGPSVTLSDGMSEAFGNVFSEAQAMGLPVVSFRHGGIPETMCEGVTGLLATERDVDQLAAHLLRFLTDDTFWWTAREQGMAWVRRNFDVHFQTEKLEMIYDAVVRQFRPDSQEQTATIVE